jgi:acyl carrier protein
VKIPDFLLAEFIHIVGPDWRHLIEPDAELAKVGVGGVDKLTLACAIDESLLTEIPDLELARWETVGDVADSATRRGG